MVENTLPVADAQLSPVDILKTGPQIVQYPTSCLTIILPKIFAHLHPSRVDHKPRTMNFLQKLIL